MAKPKNPPGPIRSAAKYADFGSDDKLAMALRTKFPDTPWPEQVRSLGTQLGNLDKGQRVWWINHPDNAKNLTELLEVSLADLGLHGPAQNSHVFSFDDFPELPPLDLKRGKPWALGVEHLDSNQKSSMNDVPETLEEWFKPALWVGRSPNEMNWLHIDDDLERKLISKAFAAAGNFEVSFVEVLADVGNRFLNPKPLIVSVRASGGDGDLVALARWPENAGVLVIAPFMLPDRKETSSAEQWSWERFSAHGQERDIHDLTATKRPLFGKGVKRWTWTLFPDWRNRLLKWAEAKVAGHGLDSSFSEQRIGKWLDDFDPRGEWFCTTTDMMQLCRLGHSLGRKLPSSNDPAAGSKLVASLFSKETPSLSFQVKHLAEARWQRRELPWQGSIPLETWLMLAPPSMLMVTRDDLSQIAQGKTAQTRKESVDRVAGLLETGNPDALLASGLLKQGQCGCFDFQHRTLAGLVVRDSLMRQITCEPLASWALTCFDHERRSLVDATLDALSVANLAEAADRIHQEAPDAAVVIAASEALFMAVARRIAQGESFPPKLIPALMSVAECVLERLDLSTVNWMLPTPWSRPTSSQDEQLEWISACWSWSLLSEPPRPMIGNWLFPDWCVTLPESPCWLTSLWPEKECEQLSLAWQRFFFVVDQCVKDLEQPISEPPRILKMALLGKSSRGEWKVDSTWWQDLIDGDCREWAVEALLKRIELGGPGAAAKLWPSFLTFERRISTDRFKAELVRLAHVRRWLLDQLTHHDALTSLDENDLLYLGSVPESLPPTFRAPLLQMLAKASLKRWYAAPLDFFTRFGPSAAPALVMYLDHDYYFMGHAAAICLWDWEPETTAERLCQKSELSALALNHLIDACPSSHLAVATELLLADPGLLEASGRISWARRHLVNSGTKAERLVAIISQTQSGSLPFSESGLEQAI
jgi:hypothetical protein